MIAPIVFDIDMTLTSEWYINGQVRNLKPNLEMVSLATSLNRSGVPIVLATARREDLKQDTEFWLESQGLVYQDLLMRGFYDYRHDPYVKRDQANAIAEKWGKPLLWYDDNKEVCEVVRDCGIPCIQVYQDINS